MGLPPVTLDRQGITHLLAEWSRGDREALIHLIPQVIGELRTIAARQLAGEPPGITLQPTAVVNELYLRLAGRHTVHWKNREHFFGTVAQMIRRILIDHARNRRAVKRGCGAPVATLDEVAEAVAPQEDGLIAIGQAVDALEQADPRLSQIVHLRFFVGLSTEETAAVLGVSSKTVKRDWQKAKMWLYRQIADSQKPLD